MKASIRQKLEKAEQRLEELRHLLAGPEVLGKPPAIPGLVGRVRTPAAYRRRVRRLSAPGAGTVGCRGDADRRRIPTCARSAPRRSPRSSGASSSATPSCSGCCCRATQRDERNIYLEIRAGTGGDEAAIFAGDLLRMYSRYAESQGWQIETLSESPGEHGGYREVICRIVGRGAFSRLKFESGTHRVQRVPATEAQGRIHTSDGHRGDPAGARRDREGRRSTPRTCASTPTAPRAPAASTSTRPTRRCASRICPSGIVVECQDERSQHKNRSRAMSLLAARLLAAEQEKQLSAQARSRKLQVGTAERSERIRTYNFPQGRVTDHRINLTLYRLPDIMEGQLDELLAGLQQEYQAELLAAAE